MNYTTLTPDSPELQSLSPIHGNLAALQQLFPSVVREGKVDFDALRQLLGDDIAKEDELYGLQWHGKARARRNALTPSLGTLRPCKAESKNWDGTRNLYIEGDNLEVLKLLQKSYAGKVKMIYIDPPYNTGKEFVYPDNYQNGIEHYLKLTGQTDSFKANAETGGRYHTDWLNMMYPRLMLARELLSDDGVIFISIDEKEIDNLRKLCSEIFGERNFAGEIVWKNSSKNDEDYISIQHEYIVSYVKNKDFNLGNWKEKKEGTDEIFKAFERFKKTHGSDWKQIHLEALNWYKQFPESNPIFNSKHYSWMDERGIYFPADISGPNFGQYVYDVTHPVTGKICKAPASGWRFPEITMKERIANGLVHFGEDETRVPNNKTYLKDTLYQSISSVKYKDGRVASKKLTALLGGNFFNNPKDIQIIHNLILSCISDSRDALILDFFSGSATTAHAVMQLNAEDGGNRRFIMVQLPEACVEGSEAAKAGYKNICEIGKERIRRAGEKVKEEAGEKAEGLDIGFRVFKLDSSNVKPWDTEAGMLNMQLEQESNLRPERSSEDIFYEVLLKQGIELTEDCHTREVAGHTVYSLGYGQYYCCFDERIGDEAQELAAGIALWHAEEDPDGQSCVVYVRDSAFDSADIMRGTQGDEGDARKKSFCLTLEQSNIMQVKAI